ncbi:MAG: hypothetical protein IVW57_18445, partial [Ktedonobacterales bacterium]|nr:hypothetical protein [Ktedonobacterales bacterium]
SYLYPLAAITAVLLYARRVPGERQSRGATSQSAPHGDEHPPAVTAAGPLGGPSPMFDRESNGLWTHG